MTLTFEKLCQALYSWLVSARAKVPLVCECVCVCVCDYMKYCKKYIEIL